MKKIITIALLLSSFGVMAQSKKTTSKDRYFFVTAYKDNSFQNYRLVINGNVTMSKFKNYMKYKGADTTRVLILSFSEIKITEFENIFK